jgi:hypothetical protein
LTTAFGAEAEGWTALLDPMRLVASDVRGGVFEGCAHAMLEEASRAIVQ